MNYPTSPTRQGILHSVASMIPLAQDVGRNIFVGIDGVDGSGKTVFADELAEVLALRQPTTRISIDGFHKRRPERYRLGRDSPEGFWQDSYDYDAFHRHVMSPLLAGMGPYLSASHDLETDELLEGPDCWLGSRSAVVVDGIFLHRLELRDAWDFSVFLDVEFSTSVARMAMRDGSNPDPEAPSNRRYVEGQRFYFDEARPQVRASITIDNNDILTPKVAGKASNR